MPWVSENRTRAVPFAGARNWTDEAARRFLGRVYRFMAVGLGVTGAVALFVASSPALLSFFVANRGVFMAVLLAQLVMVLAFTPVATRASAGAAAAMFFGYAALSGITFASLFLVYTGGSIASTFLVTGGAFAGLSAYGALTKRNLDGWGSFLFMGLIGLVIGSVVNLFLGSPMLYWLTTFVGVIVFTGLTAYDTAKLKAIGAAASETDGEAATKQALQGALVLYLDFVNLFLLLLRLFGGRRRD